MERKFYKVKNRDSMRTVDVIFVSDELVGSTIVSKKEYERILRQRIKADSEKPEIIKNHESNLEDIKVSKRKINHSNSENEFQNKQGKFVDDVELALAALENDNVDKIKISHPSMLFDDGDVSAKEICNFDNTRTIVRSQKQSTETSHKVKSGETSGEENKKERNQTLSNEFDQTPITLRKRVIKDIRQIQKILENSDNDDFSSSDGDSSFKTSDNSPSGSDSDSDNIYSDQKSKKQHSSKSNKSFFKSYCDLNNSKKSNYSEKSLKNLKCSKLTQEKLDELIGQFEVSKTHKSCMKTLFNEVVSLFSKWEFILEQNFNLLLYGAGSKMEIIRKFVERYMDVSPIILVNGFFPNVSSKEILEKICDILKMKSDYDSEIIDKIERKIQNYNLKIYIAINNIDGVMLRNKKVQSMLSQLGKIEQIHIIASIDHINAPLLWDMKTSSEFNWIWFDTTTFLNYTKETVFEGNIMLKNNEKATLSSLRNVFNALTNNSRGIFLIMIENQIKLENKKTGISFKELYEKCRKELLISSDIALRTQLKEFIDHAILKQKKNADGEDQFLITIETNILKQFLEEQESNH